MEQENTTQTPPESTKDQQELSKCQQELAEWKDRCLRLNAEFENYKKRELRDRQHGERVAQQELLLPLLPIIDNFQRALAQRHTMPAEVQPLLQGIDLIAKELEKFLHKIGVQQIQEVTTFNPELHEAVMQVSDSGKEPGTIVAVLEPGYRFKGQVLRPARVSVAV
jgi:molecular chaperone GrpE